MPHLNIIIVVSEMFIFLVFQPKQMQMRCGTILIKVLLHVSLTSIAFPSWQPKVVCEYIIVCVLILAFGKIAFWYHFREASQFGSLLLWQYCLIY